MKKIGKRIKEIAAYDKKEATKLISQYRKDIVINCEKSTFDGCVDFETFISEELKFKNIKNLKDIFNKFDVESFVEGFKRLGFNEFFNNLLISVSDFCQFHDFQIVEHFVSVAPDIIMHIDFNDLIENENILRGFLQAGYFLKEYVTAYESGVYDKRFCQDLSYIVANQGFSTKTFMTDPNKHVMRTAWEKSNLSLPNGYDEVMNIKNDYQNGDVEKYSSSEMIGNVIRNIQNAGSERENSYGLTEYIEEVIKIYKASCDLSSLSKIKHLAMYFYTLEHDKGIYRTCFPGTISARHDDVLDIKELLACKESIEEIADGIYMESIEDSIYSTLNFINNLKYFDSKSLSDAYVEIGNPFICMEILNQCDENTKLRILKLVSEKKIFSKNLIIPLLMFNKGSEEFNNRLNELKLKIKENIIKRADITSKKFHPDAYMFIKQCGEDKIIENLHKLEELY